MSRQERVVMKVADDDTDDGIGVMYKPRSQGFNYKAAFVMVSLLLMLAVGFMSGYFVAENSVPPQANVPNNVVNYGEFSDDAWNAGGGNNIPNGLDPCASRQCCVALESAPGSQRCNSYDVSTCLDDPNCDWNCEAKANGRRSTRAQGHRRRYKGKASRNGIFRDFQDLDDLPASGHGPSTWQEYQEATSMESMDECGDVFEDTEDDETAQEEFRGLGQRDHSERAASIPSNRRLVQIGTQDQHRITSKASVESVIGLLTFKDATGTEQWCTLTKVSKKHGFTAGHCCNNGANQWFSDWKWYPAVISYADKGATTPIVASNPAVFTSWTSYANRDYDICVLKLDATAPNLPGPWMGYSWDNTVSTSWTFDYSGYPKILADSYGIKWGETSCRPTAVLTQQLEYTCDTAGGQSGMGLYKTGTFTIYCLHVTGSSVSNACCRLTEEKFNGFYNYIVGDGGYA